MKIPLKTFLLGTFLVLSTISTWADDTVRVQVKEAVVRAKASFLGSIVGRLPYGAAVKVLQTSGSWSQVRSVDQPMSGWLSSSAISTAKIEANAGAAGVTTSSNENSLAGKGFTEQIEQNYKDTKHVDYTWVDKMEKIEPPADILESIETNGPKGAFQ